MAKFLIQWTETVTEYWEVEVEADSLEDATDKYWSGDAMDGSEVLTDTNPYSKQLELVVKLEEDNG